MSGTARRTELAGEPEVRVLADADAVSAAAADEIAAVLRSAADQRGVAHWATTGGSAPIGIYQLLAVPPLRDEVPWDRVHLWWGDDRYVPRDHPLSNVLPADAILLSIGARAAMSGIGEAPHDVEQGAAAGVAIPTGQVHPFPVAEAIGTDRGAAWTAARYVEELRAAGLPVDDGWPAFDLVLLGIGPDGHLMSVFPGSSAFEAAEWALPIPAPTHVEPHVTRVTLNPRVLDVARAVVVVVHGAGKRAILGEIFGSQRDVRRLPAQLARRPGALWLLDDDAAAGLPGRPND